MTKLNLIEYAKKCSATHPHLKDEIYDFVYLAYDEIEDGGSEEHETSLAYEDIKQLIDEDSKKV